MLKYMLLIQLRDPASLQDSIETTRTQLGNAFQNIEIVDPKLGIAKLTFHEGARHSLHALNVVRWHGWTILEKIESAA